MFEWWHPWFSFMHSYIYHFSCLFVCMMATPLALQASSSSASLLSPPSSSLAVKHGPFLLNLKKKIQVFQTKHMRKLLCILYLEHKINNWVPSKISFFVCPQEPLLATVNRWKLAWFRYVTCHDSLSKTIPQGTLNGEWRHSQQRRCWMDNIKEWTYLPLPELPTRASSRKDWTRISAESSLMSPRWPSRSRDWTELMVALLIQFYPFIHVPVLLTSASFQDGTGRVKHTFQMFVWWHPWFSFIHSYMYRFC